MDRRALGGKEETKRRWIRERKHAKKTRYEKCWMEGTQTSEWLKCVCALVVDYGEPSRRKNKWSCKRFIYLLVSNQRQHFGDRSLYANNSLFNDRSLNIRHKPGDLSIRGFGRRMLLAQQIPYCQLNWDRVGS